MKKIIISMLAMIFTANVANAQLSSILGKVASAVQSKTSNGNSALADIAGVISSKLIPNSTQIVGTWTYQEPAVMFTSQNALKNTASNVASKTIERKLQEQLNKIGFKQGKMTITFKEDKTFTVNRNGKAITSGTYTINNEDIQLTFKGKKQPCKITPQLNNGSLIVVTDATRLKTFLEGIGANIPQLATVVSLLKQADGLKVGIRMTK